MIERGTISQFLIPTPFRAIADQRSHDEYDEYESRLALDARRRCSRMCYLPT